MYLRTTQRRNKDGSVVRYYALAENVRHPGKGYVEARVVHSFGRADRLDRAALERLGAGIRRIREEAGGEAGARDGSSVGGIAIEAAFELGVVHVARALWAKLGIGEAIQAELDEKRLTAPHATALLAMVAQRPDRPGPKLACHERWLDRVWLPEARDGTVKLMLARIEKRRRSSALWPYAAASAPATSAQIAKACARAARYSAAGR